MAVLEDDPPGGWRADWRAALVASTVANQWRGKGDKAVMPADLMPTFGPQKGRRGAPRRASVEEEVAAAMAWVAKAGGPIRGPGD